MYASVGAVVVVDPWSLILIFYGVCVTVPTVPMFFVAPVCSCCIPSKVIVSLSNYSIIYCNLIRSRSYACQGLGGLGGLGGIFCLF